MQRLHAGNNGKYGVAALCLGMALIAMMLFPPPAQSWTTSYFRVFVAGENEIKYEDQLFAYGQRQHSGINTWEASFFASAIGSFDLSRGEAKFNVFAQNQAAWAEVDISIRDKIHPHWEDANKHDPMTIKVVYAVSGTYATTGGKPDYNSFCLYATFDSRLDNIFSSITPTSYENLVGGSKEETFTLTFVPGTNEYISIYEDLGACLTTYSFQTAAANFSQTATIQVILPEGATFSSDSGVFLTESTAIPLPGAVWLLGSGLLGLVGLRRFRKS